MISVKFIPTQNQFQNKTLCQIVQLHSKYFIFLSIQFQFLLIGWTETMWYNLNRTIGRTRWLDTNLVYFHSVSLHSRTYRDRHIATPSRCVHNALRSGTGDLDKDLMRIRGRESKQHIHRRWRTNSKTHWVKEESGWDNIKGGGGRER